MQAALFYLLYPFIYGVALLPFRLLYILSDFLYFIIKLTGYRKAVIVKNLKNSFPEKQDDEINSLANRYYRYLCDLILETLKTLRMDEKESAQHCIFHNTPWLEELQQRKQSFIIVMGHYGNWEWAGPSFTLATGFQLVVVYRPLSNKYFENMMVKMRTRFGTRITPVNNTLRDMVANRKELTATALIADQNASPKNAQWTNFLNQDTAVFTGPEKLAIKFNYPVVYIQVKRTRRGLYEVYPELLFMNPGETKEGEISARFMKRLEDDIVRDPVPWLWSHRRWKHRRNTAVTNELN